MSHKKDLTPSALGGADDTRIVVVHDGDNATPPVITRVFVNGQELLLSAGSPVTILANPDDVFRVALNIVPTSIELIDETEMGERLIEE